MTAPPMPPPLDRFVFAVKTRDAPRFQACLNPGAKMDDWRRRFAGKSAIKGGSDRELIAAKGGRTGLQGHWASKIFTGDGSFDFMITDGHIRTMRIMG